MPANVTQVPPQNIEAERAVLGAVLMSRQAFEDISSTLLKPEDFYQTSHMNLFKAVLAFRQERPGQEIDLLTISDFIRSSDVPGVQNCVDNAYLAGLTADVPTLTNARLYAKMVKDCAIRRKLLELSSLIHDGAYDESRPPVTLLDDFGKNFSELSNYSGTRSFENASVLVAKSMTNLDRRRKEGAFDSIPTGYSLLDQVIGGFREAEYSIIAARPSVGKTAFALSMAGNMAIRQNVKVGFFSLEMSGTALMDRLLSAESKVNASHIRNGAITTMDYDRVFKTAEKLYDMTNLWIQDTPNMKLYDLRSQARKMVHDEKVRIIFIDYLGLIDADMKGDHPRWEQVAYVSRSLKQLARELNIPVVALCQVGRESEKQRPTLANLRDSGSIEQDADLVIMLHKDRKDEAELGQESGGAMNQQERPEIDTIDVIVAKQRNGEVGTIHLGYHWRTVHFENIEVRQE